MRYGSVCSGIEAATVAWHTLGWEPVFFSEIEPFPCAVLKHYYPDVPNLGDMTKFKEWPDAAIDILVGGTPCQSFSVAGLRKGLDDPRGNLMLTFGAIAAHLHPKWIVWENVPGVLSSNAGRDFGSFLGMLAELGYGFAYRVLDAVFFGTPMRRRRVYVVGCLDWRCAAAVLFEQECLFGNSKKIPYGTLYCVDTGIKSYDRSSKDNILIDEETNTARLLTPEEIEIAFGYPAGYTNIPHIGRSNANEKSNKGTKKEMEFIDQIQINSDHDKSNDRRTVGEMRHLWKPPYRSKLSHRSQSRNGEGAGNFVPRMQHQTSGYRGLRMDDACLGVSRRERLAPDGPRYKALGNSMAVPVMRWIGERIQLVEDMSVEVKQ